MINTSLFVLPAAETLELLLLQIHLFTFSEEINDSSPATRQTLNQSYKCFCWRNSTNSPVREQTSAAAHQVYIILYNKSNWMRTSSTSTCYTKISACVQFSFFLVATTPVCFSGVNVRRQRAADSSMETTVNVTAVTFYNMFHFSLFQTQRLLVSVRVLPERRQMELFSHQHPGLTSQRKTGEN